MQRPSFDQQVTFCTVPDLSAASEFYGDLLGLPLTLDQGPCRIYRVGRDAFLGFCTATANLPETGGQGVILTLVVDSPARVDAWAAYLERSDAAEWISQGPTLNERFNIYHLFLKDPAGYLVEIQAFLDPSWPKETNGKT